MSDCEVTQMGELMAQEQEEFLMLSTDIISVNKLVCKYSSANVQASWERIKKVAKELFLQFYDTNNQKCLCHAIGKPDGLGHVKWWVCPDCPEHKHLRE